MISKADRKHFNTLMRFLAKRDFESVEDVKKTGGGFDLVVTMPGALLCLGETLAEMYGRSVAKNYIIAGGTGHSTRFIAENIKKSPRYKDIATQGCSEAEMYFNILQKLADGPKDNVYLDTKSTNSGENSAFALEITKKSNLPREKVLVMQDPAMQLRTYLTFKKQWDAKLYSYTPAVPLLDTDSDGFAYDSIETEGLWTQERYVSLILGEMYRIEDNETGYGPKGKNFIAHIDLPAQVKDSYYRLRRRYTESASGSRPGA